MSGADSSSGVTRRELFRRGGTAAAATAAIVGGGSRIAPRFSPVGRAAAVAPLIPIGVIGGAAAVKYATGKTITEHILGDNRDYSGYTGASALKTEVRAGATEMMSADERVMTSIENNLANSKNVAYAKGKVAAVEEMNAGNSESAATTALQNAIDEYYTTIQKNIINHWEAQWSQWIHHYDQFAAHADITAASEFHVYDGTDFEWQPFNNSDNDYYHAYNRKTTKSITYLNGDTATVHVTDYNFSDGPYVGEWAPTASTSFGRPQKPLGIPDGSGGYIGYFESTRYRSAYEACITKRDEVNGNLSQFVSDLYSYYEPGEIPTEDLIDPVTAATEMNQDYEDRGFYSASAAMLGIPTNAEFSAQLEIVSSEASDGVWEVEADIFTRHVPTVDVAGDASISSGVLTLSHEPVSNSTYELTTTAPETIEFSAAKFSDNGDGTWSADLSADLTTTSTSVDVLLEEDAFRVGQTYQPSNWSDPFYIAYAYEDEVTGELTSDFTEIESEFTIVKVSDSLGNEVEKFKNDSQNTQTSDIATLEEELAQIRDAQIRMQKEAQSGGATGGTSSSSDNQMLILGGLGALALSGIAALGMQEDSG